MLKKRRFNQVLADFHITKINLKTTVKRQFKRIVNNK